MNGFLRPICILAALAAAISGFGPRAGAQTAPAGNAHPKEQAVSDYGGASPFGDPVPSSFDISRKKAFAHQVDLSPLRDLAVFNDGRQKILDTIARETVAEITGKKKYIDFEPISGAAANQIGSVPARKVSYDPLFTFFDLLIDPLYYVDKPLIQVDYLPLREAILATAYTETSPQYEWWKKQGRLTPLLVNSSLQQVAQSNAANPAFQRALGRVSNAMGRFGFSWHNLMLIAPATPDGPWGHLSSLSAESPGGKAITALAVAWRAGDAPGACAAISTLAAELPRINAQNYPTTRRQVERFYNAANPFEYGYWMYCLALVQLLLAFGTGRRWLVIMGVSTLLAAIALHLSGFAARCYIAERLAIQNQFESMTGLSLGATLVGTAVMILRRQWLFGAAAAGVGFMVLITATQTGIPGLNIEREAPILNTSVLLKYHVTTVLTSYGLISLGFMVSLFYLGTYYAAKLRARAVGGGVGGVGGTALAAIPGGGFVEVSAAALGLGDDAPKGTQRVLSDLDKAQMIVLQLAFWGLGVGILLGAWWADHSWGRWWAFDPKELWALITWLCYLIVIHLRLTTGKNRALVTAWMSVVGFFVMLWTYFGVNLLLPGLHAYA
jgi:cytochrome c-type biogenesis protein CcsB